MRLWLLVLAGVLATSSVRAAPPVVRGPGMPPTAPRVRPVVRPPSYSPTGGYIAPTFKRPAPLPAAIHLQAAKVPAFVPPPANADKATLLAASRDLIARQAVRSKNLLPTTGYASLDEIGTKTAQLSPTRAKVVEMLRSGEKFEFAMRAPAGIRASITEKGFLSQHDTMTTRGSTTATHEVRTRVEASFLGLSPKEYEAVPNAIKPKYGFLRPARATGIAMADGAEQYGEDVFVFKQGSVKDHLTFYPLDSVANSPLGWPPKPLMMNALGEPAATEWHQMLLPWSDRMLLAPDLDVPQGTNELRLHGARPPQGFNTRPQAFSRYVELQIWRPLGIEDVERFEFGSTPPSGAFLQALRAHHVPIFRVGDTQEWTGERS